MCPELGTQMKAEGESMSTAPWDRPHDSVLGPPRAWWHEYFAALGKFMFLFARAESSALVVLRQIAERHLGVRGQQKTRTLQALIGQMRLATTKDALKRLLRVNEEAAAAQTEVARVFAQLSEIQFMRDLIAHEGANPVREEPENWKIWVSTMHSAREAGQVEHISFTVEDLDRMSDDLFAIPDLLARCLLPAWTPPLKPSPWRYRPDRLIRTGPKHDRTARSGERPRRASRK
jgi:hypothetical protein